MHDHALVAGAPLGRSGCAGARVQSKSLISLVRTFARYSFRVVARWPASTPANRPRQSGLPAMGNHLCSKNTGARKGGLGSSSSSKPIRSSGSDSAAATTTSPNRSLEKPQGYIYGVTETVRNLYNFKQELGRGQFGVTYLVEDRKTGEQFACKSIAKKSLRTKQDAEDVAREIQVMYHLAGDPYIVELRGVYEDLQEVHLVMELCTGGELFDRIVEAGHYSEADAARLCRTIVKVVAHCHKMGVLHRDLKPENFLLKDKSEQAMLKCIDFGLSAFFRPGQAFKDVVGSPYYVAPEVLRGRYTYHADVWSCGVMLYILLSGVPPFWGDNEQKIINAILKCDYDFEGEPWPSISEEAKDCIRKLLQLDPNKRATAEEILQHPWMKENGVASEKPLDNIILSRMRKFGGLNALKRQAMHYIVNTLSEEQLAGMQNQFKALDKDGNGSITLQELKDGFRGMGSNLEDDEIDQLVASIDEDNNGEIDYSEFVTACLNTHHIVQQETLMRDAFNSFDLDGDGSIDIYELHEALKRNNNRKLQEISLEVEAILKEVDTDGDGKISFSEFRSMMLQGNEYVNRQISDLGVATRKDRDEEEDEENILGTVL